MKQLLSKACIFDPIFWTMVSKMEGLNMLMDILSRKMHVSEARVVEHHKFLQF